MQERAELLVLIPATVQKIIDEDGDHIAGFLVVWFRSDLLRFT